MGKLFWEKKKTFQIPPFVLISLTSSAFNFPIFIAHNGRQTVLASRASMVPENFHIQRS